MKETVKKLIQQENEMVNHRMGWFLSLQGFLFAGLAFGWDKGVALSIVFCVVGALSSFSIGLLLRFSILAIKKLEESVASDVKEPIIGRGYSETPAIIHFLMPWHLMPVVLFIAWLALIFIRMCEIA